MAAVHAAAHQHCSAPRTGSRKPWQCYLQGLSTASGPAASNPLWGSRAVTAFGKSRQEINSLSWHGHREKSLTGSHLWSRRARGHQRAAGERETSYDTEGKGVSSTTWGLQMETMEKGFGQMLGNVLDRWARLLTRLCAWYCAGAGWSLPAPPLPSPDGPFTTIDAVELKQHFKNLWRFVHFVNYSSTDCRDAHTRVGSEEILSISELLNYKVLWVKCAEYL